MSAGRGSGARRSPVAAAAFEEIQDAPDIPIVRLGAPAEFLRLPVMLLQVPGVLLEPAIMLFESLEDLPNLRLLLRHLFREGDHAQTLVTQKAEQGIHLTDERVNLPGQGLDLVVHLPEAGGGGLHLAIQDLVEAFER